MPLRDHFQPPWADRKSWDGVHGQWPAMIVQALAISLPPRYSAAPNIHLGSSIEVDIATFDDGEFDELSGAEKSSESRSGSTLWAPAEPTLVIATAHPSVDEYEVCVYDNHQGRRLVAAIEIVSPSNKDRPEHRRNFVA